MPPPEFLTYAFDFYGGPSKTLTEEMVKDRGGFAVCAGLPKLESMVILDARDRRQILRVVLRDGMRPIFGRLVEKLLSVRVEGDLAVYDTLVERNLRAVVFGWQKTVRGENIQALTWVTREEIFFSDRQLDLIETT